MLSISERSTIAQRRSGFQGHGDNGAGLGWQIILTHLKGLINTRRHHLARLEVRETLVGYRKDATPGKLSYGTFFIFSVANLRPARPPHTSAASKRRKGGESGPAADCLFRLMMQEGQITTGVT